MDVERSDHPVTHHLVHFYESDAEMVSSVSRYLAAGLDRGEPALVFATASHREMFEVAIAALRGSDDAASSIAYVDAEEALEQLFVDGRIVPERFESVVASRVRDAVGRGGVARAYGELVELLWTQGRVAAAVELEEQWDRLGAELPFKLFCAYSMPSLQQAEDLDAFNTVCHLHTGVVAPGDDDIDAGPAPCAVRAFPASRTAPRAARRFVADAAATWGVSVDGDAALIVSELATNAVVHARSPFTVTMTAEGGVVRLAVRDESADLRAGSESDLLAESGRGLGLVAALATRWGVRRLDGAKEVWAEVAS